MKYFFLNLLLFPFVFYCQYTSIPDPVFENVLINYGLDTIQDGQVLTSNISGVQFLDVSDFGISDLTGIEDFTSLVHLDCYDNSLTNLDVSQNINLEWLDCESNYITNLDVSQNINLKTLWCYENQLQSINVTGCNNLEDFEFDNNQLNSIDISSNINIIHIDAFDNNLTSLDISNNTALTDLNCRNNNLISLDLSNNSNIEVIRVQSNNLECLNIKNGNNSALIGLSAQNNPDLTCIQVDDSAYSTNNWLSYPVIPGIPPPNFFYDSTQFFSNECNYSSNCFLTTEAIYYIKTLSVYPNPCKEKISISVENFNGNIKTEVFDLIGNRLKVTNETTISLRDCAKGIYILKVAYGNRVKEVKVIKD